MLFIAEQCLQTVFCGINQQFRKKYTSGISRKYLSSYSRRKLNSKMTSVLLEMPSRGIKSVFFCNTYVQGSQVHRSNTYTYFACII